MCSQHSYTTTAPTGPTRVLHLSRWTLETRKVMATVLWRKRVMLQTWCCNLGLPIVFWCGLPLQLQMGHQHGARQKPIQNHIPNKTIPPCRQDKLTVSQHRPILHLHQPLLYMCIGILCCNAAWSLQTKMQLHRPSMRRWEAVCQTN